MLNVQINKLFNHLIEEFMVIPRLVNQQTLDFNAFCEYLADGSTVTAADVSAVMKQIEMRLPLLLALNAKVVCSPEGLSFRPAVSGSITQSQLKKKLEARLEADPTADVDVNREVSVSDLAVSDLTASIAIDLPKKWNERFQSKAEFKRVKISATGTTEEEEEPDSTNTGGDNTGGGSTDNGGGTNNGGDNSGDNGGGGTLIDDGE